MQSKPEVLPSDSSHQYELSAVESHGSGAQLLSSLEAAVQGGSPALKICELIHEYFSTRPSDVSALAEVQLPRGMEVFWQQGYPPIVGETLSVRNATELKSVRQMTDEKQSVIVVPEGHIIKIDRNQQPQPFLYLDMSYCSAIIGIKGDEIWVAHIRDSERTAVLSTLSFMKNMQQVDTLFAIASIGLHPEMSNDSPMIANGYDYGKVTNPTEYLENGIPNGNLRTFHMTRSFDRPHVQTDHNRASVVVTPELVASYLWDLDRNFSSPDLVPVFGKVRELEARKI